MNDRYTIILWGCIVPFGIVIFSFLIALALSLYLRRKQSIIAMSFPIILWLSLCLIAISKYGTNYSFAISSCVQTNADQRLTVGEVEDIQIIPGPPYYFDSVENTFCPAKFVIVDDVPYYTINNRIQLNDWVKIDWTIEGKVANQIDIISEQEALQLLDSATLDSTEIETPLRQTYNTQLRIIPLLLLICYLVIQNLFGQRIAKYLENTDKAWNGDIVPRKYGILLFSIHIIFLLSIAVYWGMPNWTGAILITAIVGVIWTAVFIDKRTTRVFLSNNAVVVKRLFKTRIYFFKDIKSVQWGKSSTKYNRTIVLTLHSGVGLILQQEEYIGLEKMYYTLTKKLKTGDNTVP